MRQVTGLDTTTDGIPVQGMLDPDIVKRMMRRAGARQAEVREAMPRIVLAAERYYVRVCPSLHDKHCPAVGTQLEWLTGHGLLLGLVTGNLTRIGWRKLERACLAQHFLFGAFGEMASTRAGLAKIAIRQARESGWISRETPISLIGDSPADIEAARRNGIRSIAVMTGITPAGELRAAKPDFLLKDLRGLRLKMVR